MNLEGTADVTAVVVTYQSAGTLGPLLASAQRCHAASALEFVFVDNGSTDGTPETLADQVDWATVIATGLNNGFGRGCNIGLDTVTTRYTLFLNPDAQIEPEDVNALVAFMDAHPKVGIAGPATLCGDVAKEQTWWQVTSDLPTPWSIFRANVPLLPAPLKSKKIRPELGAFQTGWVCGAIFMIRTDLARRLGGFDPRFFLYWEEMDLCRRAQDIGFETWAVGSAIGRHICGASSNDDATRVAGCIGEHFYQSRRHYLIKHHGWTAATVAELGEYVLLWLRTCVDLVRGKGRARIQPRLQAPLLSQPKQ